MNHFYPTYESVFSFFLSFTVIVFFSFFLVESVFLSFLLSCFLLLIPTSDVVRAVNVTDHRGYVDAIE